MKNNILGIALGAAAIFMFASIIYRTATAG